MNGYRAFISCLTSIALFFAGPIIPAYCEISYPAGLDPFRFDYELFYQAAVDSMDIDLLPSQGPYDYKTWAGLSGSTDFSSALRIADNMLDYGDFRFFSVVSEKYKSVDYSAGDEFFALKAGARYRPSEYFGALVFFDLNREKAVDPNFTGKKWRGFAGDLESAAIYFSKGNLFLTFGRQRVFWGPRPVNLILSETAEPLDQFSAVYENGRFLFSFIFAGLDEPRPDPLDFLRFPDRSFEDNRFLVGHRFDMTFLKKIRLGFFETSLFGGEGRYPELYYLNPLQFFHTAQLNEGEDDNTIVGMDISLFPARGVNLYGQFIIDDFQIEKKSQDDQEPNEIGFMAGIFRSGGANRIIPDVRIEYTRIANRTYHQRDPTNRYLYRNKLLGHPLGPDADSLSIAFSFWLNSLFTTEIEFALRRHGEGSIYKAWDEPWRISVGEYHEPFPSGIVENKKSIALGINGYPPIFDYCSQHLYFSLKSGYDFIENSANVAGNSEKNGWLELSLSWLGFLDLSP